MITILTGENDFEIDREVRRLTAGFDGAAELIEAGSLTSADLPDILQGATLFARSRMVVIKDLSDNRAVWTALPEYVEKVAEETHLVLIEPKLDKRTKTYKMLQKHASITDHKVWGERETAKAEHWAAQEAKRLGVTIDSGAVRLLVMRSLVVSEKGVVIDQWRLLSSLEKLAPLGSISSAQVEEYIDEAPVESVFVLFETALQGDRKRLKEMIRRLEATEDPFRLFGLLGGQAFWLAALCVTDKPSSEIAKETGGHPYVLGKLSPYARRLGREGAKRVVSALAEADSGMKTSVADPWLLIERALMKIASRSVQ